MADVRNTGTWQRVERGYSDMQSLISRGEYNLALVKGRQTIEQIIRLRAAKNFVIYTDLAETIDNLYRDGYIGSESRDASHTIRTLGNRAVHEGDNSPKDAAAALKLLGKEMRAFVEGDEGEGERTPVMIKPERGRSQRQPERRQAPRNEGRDIELMSDRQNPRRSLQRGQRGGSGTQSRRGGAPARPQRQSSGGGVNIYDVLRILIPLICIILLVILIRNLIPSGEETATSPVETTTEAVPVETVPETVPPTTEPPTEAPTRYMIKGNNVNVRYEPNTGARIYEQLSDGTEIGEIEEVEGGDWVKITRDGGEYYVGRDYVTPIEDAGTEE